MLGKLNVEQQQRFERSLNFFVSTIIKKFKYLYVDDVKNELLTYIYENKNNFNKSRSSLFTFLHKCLEWGTLKFIEKESKRLSNEISLSQLKIKTNDNDKFDIDMIFGSYRDDVLLRIQRIELIEKLAELDKIYFDIYELVLSGKNPNEIKRILKIKKKDFGNIILKINEIIFDFIDF